MAAVPSAIASGNRNAAGRPAPCRGPRPLMSPPTLPPPRRALRAPGLSRPRFPATWLRVPGRPGTALASSANPAFPASDGDSGSGAASRHPAAAAGAEGDQQKGTKLPRLRKSHNLDKFFQRVLWSSRTFVLAAVLGSLIMSALMFLQGMAGVVECSHSVFTHAMAGHFTLEEPDVALACVEILDKFLAGIVTLIFGIGVYELFINQIDLGEKQNGQRTERPQWLHIDGIEDLEMRLGKVVITILVVNLMAAAKKVLPTHPIHLVYIGAALFLAAGALTVLHWADSH